MNADRKSSIKHIAELIAQIKSLEEDNLRLRQQVDQLVNELEQTKALATKYRVESDKKSKKSTKGNVLKFKLATVLYADAQGQTQLSEKNVSDQLVDNLDEVFIELDNIVDKHELRKLRSLGDSLMCVGGIPNKNMTNPIEVVTAAIEMQYYIKVLQNNYGTDKIWSMRFGVHTGPATATINGRTKISYEVKGDTVNLSTRIRSFCEPGNILISENTYELVKDLIDCEYFTRMPVKYRGNIELY